MRKIFLPKLFALFIAAALFISRVPAQTTTALDDNVLYYMQHNNSPGISIAIIKDGKIALTRGYGYADVDRDIPFTPNTIQHNIASISKTIVATAVMQLWEQELFQLDDPINNYLPFAISNPYYPNVPITFRMLLCHTSSIFGNNHDLPVDILYVTPGIAPSLHDYLQSRLVPGGSLYDYSNRPSFNNYPPGSQSSYSNSGFAVLAFLIEQISGKSFEQYCQENIFQPLCMNHTSWFFTGVNTNLISVPYENSSQYNRFFDFYERLDYPAGQVKTTIVDLSKFLLMHMNYGILDGTRIIDSATEALMRIPQLTVETTPDYRIDQTIGFEAPYWFSNNTTYLGHTGGDRGAGTAMYVNLTDETGIIILQNAIELFPAAFPLYFYLDSLADTMSTAGMLPLNCAYLFNPCEQNADYWKNNTAKWALSTLPMKLGTKHYYSKNQTLALLNSTVNSDASILLAKSLIAAKLNIAQGSELAPIVLTYNAAMNLIGDKRVPYDNPVSFSSATGIQMLALAATLDSYNSGSLNTTPCSGNPSSITKNNPVSEIDKAPALYSLSVFPNPSSGNAMISFSLAQAENVSIKIFDMSGRLVKALTNNFFEQGEHLVNWNADNLNAGIYLVKMEAKNFSETKKLVVVK